MQMISGSTLKSTGEEVRVFDPNISMQEVKVSLEALNRELFQLPIRVHLDTAKFGGLFNSSKQDCLVIVNKEHDDYFLFFIVCTRTGRSANFSLRYGGISKLIGQEFQTKERESNLRGKILNSIFRVNEEALDQEYEYYALLKELFKRCLERCSK